MTVNTILHHAALAVAIAALAGAAFRVASPAVASGLQRLLATVVLAAAAAVIEALGLGLVGLGGSAPALFTAAIATWLATRALVPEPRVRAWEELVAWWTGLDPRLALLVGAAAGGWCAWSAWVLARPALGDDMVAFHLPEVVRWVQDGRPGAVVA